MVTAPVYTGLVEAAQVLAEQAKGAGVTVNVRKVDSATLYGENYLNWRFSMDDWFPRPFLTQAALSNMPGAPWNHTHFREPEFVSLVSQARRALDEGKRCELIGEAQRFLWERGGYVIWGLANQVDAYSARFGGFAPSRSGYPLGRYTIRSVGALA
jgi:peptide/nickel transport system substrate-binding protein